jgi:vacuolar-type H+-ATPase subunit E/Vma4
MIDKIEEIMERFYPPEVVESRAGKVFRKELAETFEKEQTRLEKIIDDGWYIRIEAKDEEIAELSALVSDFESRHEQWLKLLIEKNDKIIDLENRLRLYEKKAGDAFVDKTP